MATILVVDDEENIRKVLKGLLNKNGFADVLTAENGFKALETVYDNNIDLVISDIKMPEMDGLMLFEKVKKMGFPFIVLTAYGTVEMAVNSVKAGVYDFISKPFDETELVNTVKKALSEKAGEHFEAETGGDIKDLFFRTQNPAVLEIRQSLERVVKSKANMLIHGETGTGKGLLATIIHEMSSETRIPFIKVNCAAIPAALMESELFGYVKGAFTGAVIDKPGRFELAAGGTLFLDEIGELTTDMQAKLLMAIQDKEVTRLGDTKTRKADARIIAATNIDIQKSIQEKKFREDLYFRLNVVEFSLPPLRERSADIQGFAGHFCRKYAEEYSMECKDFEQPAKDALASYGWPGNIRELENVIQKIVIMEKEKAVTAEMLEKYMKRRSGLHGSGTMPDRAKDEKARVETEMIRKTLEQTGNNRTRTAELLGISRRTLLYRMKEYGIK